MPTAIKSVTSNAPHSSACAVFLSALNTMQSIVVRFRHVSLRVRLLLQVARLVWLPRAGRCLESDRISAAAFVCRAFSTVSLGTSRPQVRLGDTRSFQCRLCWCCCISAVRVTCTWRYFVAYKPCYSFQESSAMMASSRRLSKKQARTYRLGRCAALPVTCCPCSRSWLNHKNVISWDWTTRWRPWSFP